MTASPFRIDSIDVPGGGVFGLMHCPGRCGGGYGVRDLDVDLSAIEAWGAELVVSLNEPQEFGRLGVPQFLEAVQRRRFSWVHAPIPDFEPPGEAFRAAWMSVGPQIAAHLDAGARVGVHCAAGLGRTGTLVAKLLVDRGLSPDEAIKRVRLARPGTIETAEQEAYVRGSTRLLP